MRRCFAYLLLASLLFTSMGVAAERREGFASYTLLGSQGVIAPPNFDLGFGILEPLTPTFSLRYEYGLTHSKVVGRWYASDDGNGKGEERKTIRFDLHSFALGGQQQIFDNTIVWGSLQFMTAPGRINLERSNASGSAHSINIQSLYSQFGIGHRWSIGNLYRLGVDWFVLSNFLWQDVAIEDIDELPQSRYAVKHEVLTQISTYHDIKSLRMVISFEF